MTKDEWIIHEQKLLKQGYYVFDDEVLAQAIWNGKRIKVNGFYRDVRIKGTFKTKGRVEWLGKAQRPGLHTGSGLRKMRWKRKYMPWHMFHDTYCKIVE